MTAQELSDYTDSMAKFMECISEMSKQIDSWYARAHSNLPVQFPRDMIDEVYNEDLFYRMLSVAGVKMSLDLEALADKAGRMGEIVNMLTPSPLPLYRNADKLEAVFLLWSNRAKKQYENPINVSKRSSEPPERKDDEPGQVDV